MNEDHDEVLRMSPPLAYEVPGGYRVEPLTHSGYAYMLTRFIAIIENNSGLTIAQACGRTDEQARANATMIVACLNRVQQ